MVGEVREYDELAGNYEKLDTVRITTSKKKKNRIYFSDLHIIILHDKYR